MGLKKELEREFGTPVRVKAGGPGSLNVLVDGQQIYSKHDSGRFPTASELANLIRSRVAEQ